MATSYLKLFVLIFLSGVIFVGTLNWLVNPYSVFDSPNITGFNADKLEFVNHLRLTKAYAVTDIKPKAIILGTSRAGRGLSPTHPAWNKSSVYNLALPDASMYELFRYFQHANAANHLDKVILALDFRLFNDDSLSRAFSEDRLLVTVEDNRNPTYLETYFSDLSSILFSSDAFQASVLDIRRQGWESYKLFNNGRWDRTKEKFDHRKAFTAYTKASYSRLSKVSGPLTGLDHFRALLQFAHKENIDLHLAISPSHAWHWELIFQLGLWDRFETLKKELLIINEEEAKRAGKPPFALWDFSGHNSLSIEEVPTSEQSTASMKWFWESVHYKKSLGDLIIQRIFNNNDSNSTIPDDFGILLTPSNIEKHLKNLREARVAYYNSHPRDVSTIAALSLKDR